MSTVPRVTASADDLKLAPAGRTNFLGSPAIDPAAPHKSRSVLLAGGLALTGLLSGTGTTAPLAEPTMRYIGEWTSTARVASYEPAGSARLRLPMLLGMTDPPLSDPPVTDASTADAVPDRLTQAAEVKWLHEASGLTWEQIGRLFGVSRRAIHLWANGSRMNSANAERLGRLVAHVRELPGSPDERRAALLSRAPGGLSFVDQVRAQNGAADRDITGTPFGPDELLGARHDEGEPGPPNS